MMTHKSSEDGSPERISLSTAVRLSVSRGEEFRRILAARTLHTEFQPIVNLRDGTVLGYEAFTRGPLDGSFASPLELFATAHALGMTWELDNLCLRLSLLEFSAQNHAGVLFANVHPDTLKDSRFLDVLNKDSLIGTRMPASRVVLELTGRAVPDGFYNAEAILNVFKADGYRISVDDFGVGASNLNLICHVRPNFLKLDRQLFSDFQHDLFKQQIIKSAVEFARATETCLIAEGIEQEDELLMLLDLGVLHGQGYFFARPQAGLTELSRELTTQLNVINRRRLTSRYQQAFSARVGDCTRLARCCTSNATCRAVQVMFTRDEELLGIPVVDKGQPVGLVMREKFFSRLGQQYGFSLFYSRPVSTLMDENPLVVDYHAPIEIVAQTAMQRHARNLYDQILVTRDDVFHGIATVRDLLERTTEQGIRFAQYSNPLTGLPGNAIIEREIARVLNDQMNFSLLYIDLDQFKAYNDVYGFDRGDEVLRYTARLLQETFGEPHCFDPFVGHVGGDDFVVMLSDPCSADLLTSLIARFDGDIQQFYHPDDRINGYITALNRREEMEYFPFIAISIAIVNAQNGPFENVHTLVKRASEVKKLCKGISGSCYVIDRRTGEGALAKAETGEERVPSP